MKNKKILAILLAVLMLTALSGCGDNGDQSAQSEPASEAVSAAESEPASEAASAAESEPASEAASAAESEPASEAASAAESEPDTDDPLAKYEITGRYEGFDLYKVAGENGKSAIVNGKGEIIVDFRTIKECKPVSADRLYVLTDRSCAVFAPDGSPIVKSGKYSSIDFVGNVYVAISTASKKDLLRDDGEVLLSGIIKSYSINWDNELTIELKNSDSGEYEWKLCVYSPETKSCTVTPYDHEAAVAEYGEQAKKAVNDFISALRNPDDAKIKALTSDELYAAYIANKDTLGEGSIAYGMISVIGSAKNYGDPFALTIYTLNSAEGQHSTLSFNMDNQGVVGEYFSITLVRKNGAFVVASLVGEM